MFNQAHKLAKNIAEMKCHKAKRRQGHLVLVTLLAALKGK